MVGWDGMRACLLLLLLLLLVDVTCIDLLVEYGFFFRSSGAYGYADRLVDWYKEKNAL